MRKVMPKGLTRKEQFEWVEANSDKNSPFMRMANAIVNKKLEIKKDPQ